MIGGISSGAGEFPVLSRPRLEISPDGRGRYHLINRPVEENSMGLTDLGCDSWFQGCLAEQQQSDEGHLEPTPIPTKTDLITQDDLEQKITTIGNSRITIPLQSYS
jgi:hypothetical protein